MGVSTRLTERLIAPSKSQIWHMAEELDGQVEAFRTRPLDAGPYAFLDADAVTLRGVRAGG